MTNETILQLILSYLGKYKNNIFSHIDIIGTNTSLLQYDSIFFTYNKNKVEIRVYNPQFVKIKIDDSSTEICCCMSSIRNAIDKLQKLEDCYDRY